jgi:hypothetical protein
MIQGAKGNHGLLNVPFASAAEQLVSEVGFVPQMIIAEDAQTAGNLRVAFPDAQIIAPELLINVESFVRKHSIAASQVLLFSERDEPYVKTLHSKFADRLLGTDSEFVGWRSVSAPIIHGDGTERREFHYMVIDCPARLAAERTQTR